MNHLELLDSHKKLNEIQYFYMTQRWPRTGRQSIGLSVRYPALLHKAQSFLCFPLCPLTTTSEPPWDRQCPVRMTWRTNWDRPILGPLVVTVLQIIINVMNKATNMNSKLKWVMVQSCIYALTLLHIHRTWCAHLFSECLFPPLRWGGNSTNQCSWNTWGCKYQELWDVEFVPKTAVLFNTQT